MTSHKFSPSAAMDAINQFAGKFEQVLKNSPASELEKNARQRIISQLAKHGLVTREEFEIQAAMLAKARAKLVELETKLAALDSQLADTKTKA